MRGKGDTTFPASFVQAEGREPKAGHRIRYPEPGTRNLCTLPTSQILTRPYCLLGTLPGRLGLFLLGGRRGRLGRLLGQATVLFGQLLMTLLEFV
jgi:hypothetical protein